MRQIRIWYVDFWKMDPETFLFTRILKKHYEVILDEKNPEYVFCSHFGTDYLKYHCTRILYLGEAKAPDFNLYDYAMAFDKIQFGDRYITLPFYLLREDSLADALKKHTYSDEVYLSKKKFCNFVVSNGSGNPIREEYFEKLNKYRRVDSGGKYKNNLPDHKAVEDKLGFQKDYRYSLAFENSAMSGYTTEKITEAWAAATIPIYWGDPDIETVFNPKAFINCNKFESFDELIEQIEKIEKDEELYLSIMKEPIVLTDSPLLEMIKEDYLENFLTHIVEKENPLCRNSALTMWGKAYEHHIAQWDNLEHKWWFKKARDIRRKRNNRKG